MPLIRDDVLNDTMHNYTSQNSYACSRTAVSAQVQLLLRTNEEDVDLPEMKAGAQGHTVIVTDSPNPECPLVDTP